MRNCERLRPRGFTLVELLVVIAIIALLIGILVPSMGAVRKAAKNAATKAVLQAISTGLETFKADEKFGGYYPPSKSDATGQGILPVGQANSPYYTTQQPIYVTGAGLLVWAMVGADFLGTPGFKTVRGGQFWSEDSDAQVSGNPPNPARSGVYAMNANTQQPVQPRAGLYVQLDKMKMSKRNATDSTKFLIEAEEGQPSRDYPMFLDAFGFPILYWKADDAGKALADNEFVSGSISGPLRGIYHWSDNAILLDRATASGKGSPLATDGQSGNAHRLGFDNRQNLTPTNLPNMGTFQSYIMQEESTAKLSPQRSDSYLLVTPGPDGRYGTSDDVTNFSPRGG